MKTIETISELKNVIKGCVLTIGNFDGVHVGHQAILAAARQLADQGATELVAMTFEPHPVAILYPKKVPAILSPLPLKKYLLEQQKVDCLVILKDSINLLQLSPADFVDKFLVKHIQPAVVVEGETFNFGRDRAGSVQTLYDLGKGKGFKVSVVPPRQAGSLAKVSSTVIRSLLAEGNVAEAAFALGRPYRLIGRIIPGRGKGKQLGFPTLNMERPKQIVPAEGVYAGFVEISDSCEDVCKVRNKFPAVFSIGRSQTLGSDYPLLVEAHLLIENADKLKGKWMAMDFIQRIRSQEKFAAEADLITQIAKDCQKAKDILQSPERK